MDKVRIAEKRTDLVGTKRFWSQVQSYIDKGYKILVDGDRATAPRFYNYPVVWLYNEEVETDKPQPKTLDIFTAPEPTPEPTEAEKLSEALEGLNGKEELLEFAATNGFEVPEEKKNPSAIKKFLRESIQ